RGPLFRSARGRLSDARADRTAGQTGAALAAARASTPASGAMSRARGACSWRSVATVASTALLLASCARIGRLTYVPQPVSPVQAREHLVSPNHEAEVIPVRPLFGDTLVGLVPGTGDTTRRYLGRLRDGYTADTLNVFL